jgi:hypothetical protein
MSPRQRLVRLCGLTTTASPLAANCSAYGCSPMSFWLPRPWPMTTTGGGLHGGTSLSPSCARRQGLGPARAQGRRRRGCHAGLAVHAETTPGARPRASAPGCPRPHLSWSSRWRVAALGR